MPFGTSSEERSSVFESISTAMINYSIVMRPVNGNLFEINQAQAAVLKAIKSGRNFISS